MRVFDAAPPTMRSMWQLTAGHGDKTYIVYEDERLHVRRGRTPGPVAGALPPRDVRCRPRRSRRDRDAQLSRVGHRATGRPSSIGAAVVGMNAWWTSTEMEFGLADSRPKVLIADDERLERVLPVLDALRADGTAAPHRGALRPRACRPTPPDGTTSWCPTRLPTRCPRSTSIPTTTPRSSTRRARPASRRAPS